jgi:hypothetical protein
VSMLFSIADFDEETSSGPRKGMAKDSKDTSGERHRQLGDPRRSRSALRIFSEADTIDKWNLLLSADRVNFVKCATCPSKLIDHKDKTNVEVVVMNVSQILN